MLFNLFERLKNERAEVRQDRDSRKRQAEYEARDRAEAAYQREQRIERIRVLTGDLKHRYVIIDTLYAFGHYNAGAGETYDPTEATRRAIYQIQVQAEALGADAVIHAQFQILRYADPRARQNVIPTYEAHVFGTAVRIVGPPPEWHAEFAQEDVQENPEASQAPKSETSI